MTVIEQATLRLDRAYREVYELSVVPLTGLSTKTIYTIGEVLGVLSRARMMLALDIDKAAKHGPQSELFTKEEDTNGNA